MTTAPTDVLCCPLSSGNPASQRSSLSESARLGSAGTGPSSLPSVLAPWGQQKPSLPQSESGRLISQVPYSVASSALVCLKKSRRQMEINITKHSVTESEEGGACQLVLLFSH